ncbi:MAG: Gfo/Idh/MocA family protein [Anaerolineae bacterium]
MDVLRAAVVGTGFIGPAHVEALRRLGVEVTGIVGSSPERARPKAEALGIERVYPDYEALLADDAVDVVHITSPNQLHFPMARDAISAGKHVVCEKPLAMTSAESGELLRLAEEAGIVHAVNFNIRFYPICHEARERVARGDLGDLYITRGSYLQDWLLYDTDWNWRLEPEKGGRLRAVGDIGSHWLDLVTFITGQHVEAVYADLEMFLPVRKRPAGPIDTFTGKELTPGDYVETPIETEDYATILLRWDSGARGVVTVSQVSAGRKNRLSFELNGSASSLAWDSERPNELWIGRRDGPNGLFLKDPALLLPAARRFAGYPGGHNEGFPDTFKALYQAVYSYIRRRDEGLEPDFPTFADGHEEMLIGEAVMKSAETGEWVVIQR